MSDRPSPWRREVASCLAAFAYFTRLPVPAGAPETAAGLSGAAKYLPLVGGLVGAVGGLVHQLASLIWPHSVAVLLALAAMIYLTGALHEDGLADMCDGLGGGWDKDRILAIMQDSRIGTFGVLGLGLVLAVKAALLIALPVDRLLPVLVAGQVVSRAAACLILRFLDYARDGGPAKARPVALRLGPRALILVLFTAAVSLTGLPLLAGLAGSGFALVVTVWLTRQFKRWLGGYTGDCLGGVQQLSEAAFYLGVSALLASP